MGERWEANRRKLTRGEWGTDDGKIREVHENRRSDGGSLASSPVLASILASVAAARAATN